MGEKRLVDGVFNRWFLLIWLISLCTTLGQNILNNSVALYAGAEPAGKLALSYAIFAIAGRLAGGYVADRYSRRLVMGMGCLLFSVSTYLFGLASAFPALLLLRGLHGVGFAAVNTAAATASVDVVPVEKAGQGVGWFWVSLAAAGAVSAYISLGLTKMGGYPLLFGVTAAILAAGAVLAAFCRYEKLGRITRGKEHKPPALLEPAALPMGVLMFLVSAALASVNNYALLLARDRGYSLGGLFFLVSALVMAFANSHSSLAAARCGFFRSMGIACLPFCGAALLAGWCDSQRAYLLLAVGYGLLAGLANPLLNYLALKSLPPQKRGTGSSTLFVFQDAGFGAGSMFYGWAIARSGYGMMYTAAAAAALAALLLALLMRSRGVLREAEPAGESL